MILFHLVVNFGLLVMIWLIQILHYPSFHFYHEDQFPKAMAFHQRQISFIVIPLMFMELGICAFMLWSSFSPINLLLLLMVLLIWASTFFIQVPLHQRLAICKDHESVNKLVKSNWIRTFLWTLKFFLVILIQLEIY